ncbi:MAG: asparagine synthetase B [Lachnospiraceae bacterium]|nr:asparagine synthetase B [Lachnospiraceae bacterium]
MYKVTAYRGHIRNHKALCAELGVDAALPRKEKEEAILIAAYGRWGRDCGLHLHGMFAFTLRDDETDTTVLVRDAFGTKTLYYCLQPDGTLLYGTNLSDILSAEGFNKELNERMLQHYLSLSYPGGEETFFEGVKKVMPGHVLTYHAGEISIERYWRPLFSPDETRSAEDFAEEFHETVKQIMKELEADGEEADSFLSGGVDSSYVLAMSGAKRAHGCGYEFEQLDESVLAAETAKALGREFHRRIVQPEEYFEAASWVMRHMEQPLGDASAVVFAIGARSVAEAYGKGEAAGIVYSGEGSDEFFGGYNIYRKAAEYGKRLETFYTGNTNIMKEEEKRELLLRYDREVQSFDLVRGFYAENKDFDPLHRMCDIDIRLWLDGDIYLNVDRMSRAAGIEVRMPLTDLRVFDIASRVPARYKAEGEHNKLVVRMAAEQVLPKEVAYRKKLGFVVPIRYWLADETYNGRVRALLQGETAGLFFNRKELERMTEAFLGGYSDLWRKVWAVYAFLEWYGQYFG